MHRHSLNALLQGGEQRGRRAGAAHSQRAAMRAGRVFGAGRSSIVVNLQTALRCTLVEAIDAASPQTRRKTLMLRPAGSRKVHRYSLNALLQGGEQRGRRAGAAHSGLRAAMRARTGFSATFSGGLTNHYLYVYSYTYRLVCTWSTTT